MAHDRYHFRSTEAVSGFDEGGHTCLPAGLATPDVPVGDISLGSRRPSSPGAGHGPHPWAKSQRDPNETMTTMMKVWNERLTLSVANPYFLGFRSAVKVAIYCVWRNSSK